ncbi:MAG: NAD(P)-dependent oxidoreductase [Planctomycetota bacterium]
MSDTSTLQSVSAADGSSTRSVVVLIADKFAASGIDALRAFGCTVHDEPGVTADELADMIRTHNPDVIVVRSTKVKAPAIDAADRLSLIVRAGAGYDNIDVKAASARGIFVANTPGKNAIAVAELAWGLILACDRRIPDQMRDLRDGRWDKKGYGNGVGMYGRTIGIIGLGQIGIEVAHRARAFGMTPIAWSRSLDEQRADELDIGYCESIINLAKMSDVVSVHVAATPETKNFIDADFFNAMKDGAIFVNTSRGSTVDADALADAVRTKKIKAGLDVYAQQPAAGDSAFKDPIVSLPGVYGTHHNGASTAQAQAAIADETVRVVTTYLTSGNVLHCVNRASSSSASRLLTVRHLNKPGVLTHVFDVIASTAINVEEMENIIYDGALAACARIYLARELNAEQLDRVRENAAILSVEQTPVHS